jgi:hypothetical protein
MTGGWEFLEDATGQWRWRTSDAGGPRESCRTFKSGADCVAHALRHGYLAGTPFAADKAMPSKRSAQVVKTGV